MSKEQPQVVGQTVVCALYKFVSLDDFESLREPLLARMTEQDIRGTLLLAQEGINGTIAGSREGIDAILNWLNQDERLNPIDFKESFDTQNPFMRTKVKLKKEIVTMGVEGIDPKKVVGTYVKPQDWNALISDPDVVLVDTRNDYEKWRLVPLKMPMIRKPKPFANSRSMSLTILIRKKTRKSLCSAPVASAVRNRLPILKSRGLMRYIIWKAAFLNIWKRCRNQNLCGKGIVSSLTAVCQLSTAWRSVITISAMLAVCRSLKQRSNWIVMFRVLAVCIVSIR